MNAIALYVNFSRPLAKETAERVHALAVTHGVKVGICDGGEAGVGFPTECSVDEADLMVPLGYSLDHIGPLTRSAR
ncbi:MAG: hypothetical protein JWO66_1502, partial [Candidatus Eremiobacteraeota bacterium]|nr:hypothetical protein [Candidatus Eremiobacteraeota bacterium]